MRNTKKLIFAALFAAICCVLTMIVKIPSPLGGYISFGDVGVLLSGMFLGGTYGFFSAAIGSALADVFSGYIIFAPATFIIKGIMALISQYFYKKEKHVLGFLTAELFMCVGYYIYEGFLYGFGAALVEVPLNAIQGLCAVLISLILKRIFLNKKISF